MRALVVGFGRMGGFHRKVLRDLGYDVRTVDPDPEARADFPLLDEALDAAMPHVAAVAVPIPELARTAGALVGIPMLVEKPFAQSETEARLLAEFLCGTRTCVGFVERYNPQVRALRDLIGDQPVRTARLVRHSNRISTDPVLDLLTHDVDLARFLRLWRTPDCTVRFDVRHGCERVERRIELEMDDGQTITTDLTAHDTSPLHALWHAFLSGQEVPGPLDAVCAIRGARLVEEIGA